MKPSKIRLHETLIVQNINLTQTFEKRLAKNLSTFKRSIYFSIFGQVRYIF